MRPTFRLAIKNTRRNWCSLLSMQFSRCSAIQLFATSASEPVADVNRCKYLHGLISASRQHSTNEYQCKCVPHFLAIWFDVVVFGLGRCGARLVPAQGQGDILPSNPGSLQGLLGKSSSRFCQLNAARRDGWSCADPGRIRASVTRRKIEQAQHNRWL
jgi:hypothetical protein